MKTTMDLGNKRVQNPTNYEYCKLKMLENIDYGAWDQKGTQPCKLWVLKAKKVHNYNGN